MLWGSLRPNITRFLLDWGTIAVWASCVGYNHNHGTRDDTAVVALTVLIVTALLTVFLTGGNLTNRWPLTFPMMPLVALQVLERILTWTATTSGGVALLLLLPSWIFHVCSLACLALAVGLVLLFPALALPLHKGRYNVGKADFYLPCSIMTQESNVDDEETVTTRRHVCCRLLYPTTDVIDQELPYLSPASAYWHCFHSMKFGAPPPLDDCGWMLHTNRLVTRPEKVGAALANNNNNNNNKGTTAFPLVVYSHGLGGHADIYSFSTHALAADGNIVLVVSHSDGSSPAVVQADGSIRTYDYETGALEVAKKDDNAVGYHTYVTARRKQTEYRVQEVLTAVHALRAWNEEGTPNSLDALLHLDLKKRLDVDRLTLMGHSFGAATVLSVAFRNPHLVHTVVAHEYAMDWLVPEATASLMHASRIAGLQEANLFKVDLYADNTTKRDGDKIYGMFDCLLLFSHDWIRTRRYLSPLLHEMNENNRLGGKGKLWEYHVMTEMMHEGFSDLPLLTPRWMSLAIGLSGKRSPVECSHEVAQRTKDFLAKSRQSKKTN